MPSYKLTYFNIRGRAETARYLFALAEVEYEDDRVEFSDWPAKKPTTPNGQLPLMEIDGVTLCQSLTITRYLAKQFGYTGKTDLESAQCDMLVDCMADAGAPMLPIVYEQDEAKKAEMLKRYEEVECADFFCKFEKLLCANKGGDGWFVGDQMTWADVHFSTIPDYLEGRGIRIGWDKLPKLLALKKRVDSQPKIAAWIAKRPKTAL